MTPLEEAAAAAGAGLAAGLQAAVAQLSEGQDFAFTLYKRLVLPADGFVFWAPASTVSPPVVGPLLAFTVNGSLHLTQDTQQQSEANYDIQSVVFTTKKQVTAFEEIDPGLMYVLTLPNGSLLAFNGQRMRYDPAGIWHYYGRALFPFEASQVIANALDIPDDAVVSNSLPLWLAMTTDTLPVYPSFLVPQNAIPPYVSVDIENTEAIGAAPLRYLDDSQSQLTQETVAFTFYGVRNNGVLDFQAAVLDNSLSGDYGMMNSPVPVDEKQPQSEFGIIAQRKKMVAQVNYYQTRTRAVARKLILSAFITVTPE